MVFTSPVALDSLRRSSNKKVDDQAFEWYNKYHWIVDEIRKYQDEVKRIEKEYAVKKKIVVRPRDNRTVRPFPETTNQMYGWLVQKPEFKLEKYGPDLHPKRPFLPPDYWDEYEDNKNTM
ncbi:uncharacterized protein LOC123291611 [Chrysoperla carnea]|uniref:uncharacterized protein LOC123291611 n=1 Tax=Chrysoperla carnea TaxID=189513 RepID=UPI001D0663E1|nr:uncharacterized protein LOC123291611 [Chrysoperla carnea]